jgi:hypothetical protein
MFPVLLSGYLGMFFAFGVFSPASAESLFQKAEMYCGAYIKNPADFKPVKDTHSCEIYLFQRHPRKGKDYSEPAICFQHAVEGVEQNFAYVRNLGTCSNTTVDRVSDSDHPRVLDSDPKNVDVNGYGIGQSDTALDYNGVLLVTNGSDLRLPTSEGTYILCRFGYELKNWEDENSDRDSICSKFAKGDFYLLEGGGSNKADALYPGLPPDTHVETTAEVDFNHDGKNELFLGAQYSSGAGCGADSWSAAITNISDKKDAASAPEIDALNDAITALTDQDEKYNTRRVWSAVEIDGKDYVAENVMPARLPIFNSFGYKPFLDRVLYEYKNKKFVEICRAKPKMEKVIAHDVKPKLPPFLDYKPLDND